MNPQLQVDINSIICWFYVYIGLLGVISKYVFIYYSIQIKKIIIWDIRRIYIIIIYYIFKHMLPRRITGGPPSKSIVAAARALSTAGASRTIASKVLVLLMLYDHDCLCCIHVVL